MPLSPTSVSALDRIAEIAGTSEPANERLERILSAAREALGIGALSVVTASGSCVLKTWCSADNDYPFDRALAGRQAFEALGAGSGPLRIGADVITALPAADGHQTAVVAHGVGREGLEETFLRVVVGYVSMLVENCLLSESAGNAASLVNHRIRDIAAIYEIGRAIDSGEGPEVLDMIVAKAAAVMDAQTCSLMLTDPQDHMLVIEASFGLTDDIVKGARIRFGEGIAGRVAETGEPVMIDDVSADPRFSATVQPRAGVSGSMCVPLRDEDGVVHGVISIRRNAPNPPFTRADLQLFSVFATHAALAISNAELYSRLHRKVQEVSTISDVLRAINSTLELDRVLDQIVESITEVVGFDRCCVYLLDSRSNEFVAGARKGYEDTDSMKDRVRFDEGVIGLAAKEGIPIFSQGSPTESDEFTCPGEFLAAPILVRNACIGVVIVDNCVRGRAIEPQHVELLSTFVSQAGIAVENARLYEAMEEKYAELNVLYEHSRSISAAYGLDNAAEVLVNTVSRALKCDGAGLLLLDPRRDNLKLQATSGGMTGAAGAIEEIARESRCVNFVRELRSSTQFATDHAERASGANADLLEALAPGRSVMLMAPIVAEDTTIGALALYRHGAQEFQGAEIKLVSIVTSHAATVLKNALSYEQKMRQKVLELSALYEFSKEISSASSMEEALDSILAIVAELVDYDESYIYEIDREQGVASVKAARFRGEADGIPPDEPLDGGSVISWALKEQKALVSPDISRDPRFSDLGAGQRIRSLMSIPLVVHGSALGVLNVHSYSPNQYSEDDVRTLSIIASQGAAIYNDLDALTALTSYTDNILSSIAAGVVTLGSDGTVLLWNAAAETIVGMSGAEVMGLSFDEVLARLQIAEADKDNMRAAVGGVFETGSTYQGYKLRFHPESRDDVFMNMSISQLLNSAGEQLGLVLIFEDTTREIRMEEEFRRMGELAAIGQLAASIAHELRNPLSSIKGAAQFLQKEYEDESSIVEFLGIIVEEVNGLNKLTTEFLDFARPMQLELKTITLNRVVEKTLQLMSVHITDNNVVVRESLCANPPEIQADAEQLEQVLKNIIINALQAMPEGGVLTLETGATSAGGAYMAISDTGIGISPDKIDRIFQPFVTTKTKGTGLGLSVVHKIVENHGGKIEVTSEVGKGSTFRVSLPRIGSHLPIATEVDQTLERRTSGKLRSEPEA